MKKIVLLPLIAAMLLPFASCEDSVTSAGGSLVQDEVEIIIDTDFNVTGRSVSNSLVQSRTVLQLLGNIDAKGYGSLKSDIVCQYMPAAALVTDGVSAETIDSVKLILSMFKDGFAGDSVVPMGLKVYELNRQLPSPIYSDFDPTGYYDTSDEIGETVYSGLIDGAKGVGTDNSGSIYKQIYVDLPRDFGVKLFNCYKTAPQIFSDPQAFANWFPGLYIANSFGSGRVTRIVSNLINVYYHTVKPIPDTTRDTVVNAVGSYLAVTPEIITNNNITYSMATSLSDDVAAGKTLLVAPLGYDVEFTFPASEILRRYKEQSGNLSVINSLTFSIPAKNIDNNYGLTPPPYILMVKKKDKDKFFNGRQVNDNISSFYASYNTGTRSYEFSSMRDYILDIVKKGEATADDEEFVICPAMVSFYVNSSSDYYSYYYGYNTQSTQVSSITPYISQPVMAELDFSKASIKFTFSKQTLGQ